MMLRHHDNVDVALALTAGSVPAAISDILRLRSQKLAAMVKLRSSGTVWTVHANSAAQGISRFTTCVLQSGVEPALSGY